MTCSVAPLSDKDEKRIRQWLQDDAAFLFLACLKAEQVTEEVEALNSIQKQDADVCRGGPVPPSAMPHLRRAATFSACITLFEEKICDGSKLISVTLSTD